MSWIERVQEGISIETGDGRVYTPLYVLAEKSVEFNLAEFVFPNIPGSLVKRGLPKGRRYPLEILFQGDDQIEQTNAFEKSANDPRPWKISHPMYDNILVHPQSLRFDPKGLNHTKITGELIETITDEAPFITQDPIDQTEFIALEYLELAAISFENNVDPEPTDINLMTVSANETFGLGAQLVKAGEIANDYFNKYNDTLNKIAVASNAAFAAAEAIVDLYSFPSEFVDDLKRRVFLFQQQFNKLGEQLEDIFSPNEKSIYEMQAGALLTGMVTSTVKPLDTDYQSVKDVLFVMDAVVAMNNQYIENLDSLQTETGGAPDSYVPEFDSISTLSNLVSYAISQLMNVALDAKQERVFVLDRAYDIITLAHRFYGLEVDDTTIEMFANTNNIGLSEMLEIEKGKEVVYYV